MFAQIILQGQVHEHDYPLAPQRLNEFVDDLRRFLKAEGGVETGVYSERGLIDEYTTPTLEVVSAQLFPTGRE